MRGGRFAEGLADLDGTDDLDDGIGRARLRDADGWKDVKKRMRPEERRVRHAGNVAQVVTGAVAGGRLARTLRRDARRRSIFDHSSPPPPLPPPHLALPRTMQLTAYPTTSHPSS